MTKESPPAVKQGIGGVNIKDIESDIDELIVYMLKRLLWYMKKLESLVNKGYVRKSDNKEGKNHANIYEFAKQVSVPALEKFETDEFVNKAECLVKDFAKQYNFELKEERQYVNAITGENRTISVCSNTLVLSTKDNQENTSFDQNNKKSSDSSLIEPSSKNTNEKTPETVEKEVKIAGVTVSDDMLKQDFDKLGPVLWECKYCHARNDKFWAAKHVCLKEAKKNV